MTVESLKSLASKAGLVIPEKDIDDFRILVAGVDHAAKVVLGTEGMFYIFQLHHIPGEGSNSGYAKDYVPKVDLELYPRTDYHVPIDTDKGGWASKVRPPIPKFSCYR